jgi:iron(III) transport system substrate-binding protein
MWTEFRFSLTVSAVLAACISGGCARSDRAEVVVYAALDRGFSEPMLDKFEKATGIRVLVKYDTESTKTVGLVNALRAEKHRPRCDVFWNNEIVNTLRLKNEGLLAPYRPVAAEPYPHVFRDAEGYWSGFAARARVLLVNTNRVSAHQMPDSIFSLADPKWKGQTGIAKPLFGTTATHAACLFAALGTEQARAFFQSLKANDVRIASGNKTVALDVSAGVIAFGMTDTDDALAELDAGKPVVIVYPDGKPDQMGDLFIPNTLSMIKGAPHPEAAAKLIEYLLSPEVETALAEGAAGQIPLNPQVKARLRVKTPAEVKPLEVDFGQAAERFDEAAKCLAELFLE